MDTTDAVRDLARRQHGVVARRQLTELGISRPAVTRAVASGRLERLSPRVLRMAGSAATVQQRAMAAALDVPGAVALFSAAALWHQPGFTLEPVQVLATRHPHRDRARVGKMHSSVRLDESDITIVDGLPVTTPIRTVQDLAGRIHPDRLSQICDRMLANRLIRLDALHAMGGRLPPRGGARGTGALRKLVLDRPPGYRPAESNLELRFESILDRAGEAPFERQADVGDGEGWIGRVDFLDRRLRVIVEVQSALFHGGLLDGTRDAERLERLRRAGWIVVEVTDHEVFHRQEVVVSRIRAARSRARRQLAQNVPETETF